jgi:hypothetical protein
MSPVSLLHGGALLRALNEDFTQDPQDQTAKGKIKGKSAV